MAEKVYGVAETYSDKSLFDKILKDLYEEMAKDDYFVDFVQDEKNTWIKVRHDYSEYFIDFHDSDLRITDKDGKTIKTFSDFDLFDRSDEVDPGPTVIKYVFDAEKMERRLDTYFTAMLVANNLKVDLKNAQLEFRDLTEFFY